MNIHLEPCRGLNLRVAKCGSQMHIPKTKFFEKQPSQPPDALAERIQTRDERFEVRGRRTEITLHDCNRWLLQESVVAECPHEDLMAEAEEEGFSNYRVVNVISN
ncbi:hypothetical protein PROFUN_14960 [Planoprotostelium fungivorum]|uniref:Uncharacterized protein n=1 Tax=Planoprotostelium fungivorum TaxID=1890364 RepID=A0A2P6MY96_9EUKA|nr:hypothetical protein PROFUN_14960 [Planoprotostelium fungivorum]